MPLDISRKARYARSAPAPTERDEEEFVIDYSGNDPELFGGLMHFTVFFPKSESFSNILSSGRRRIRLEDYDPP